MFFFFAIIFVNLFLLILFTVLYGGALVTR
jgi:hypothetical protein